jgi:cytidylate kinase
MSKRLRIAIDGPAASGKSTTARLLAYKLGYIYIDTGAMYRAATKAILDAQVDYQDEKSAINIIRDAEIHILLKNNKQHTFLNAQDVTEQIRTPEIDRAISAISAYPDVRSIMVKKQRELAEIGGVVMDGRDIGTVVLPDAELKIYMVASLEARAKRRKLDLENKNVQLSLDEIKQDIARRDKIDSSRVDSPLMKAPDAVELDTTDLSINEQVEWINNRVMELLKQ